MQRRTVLKTIAAALFAPTIQLRQSIPDERMLKAFCGEVNCCRYQIDEPFGHGSLTYATDAYAMVRCELPNRLEVGERRLPKNIDDIWSQHWNAKQWRPLTPDDIRPTIADPRGMLMCPDCGDRRVSFGAEYPDFDDGKIVAHVHKYGYDVDDNTIRDKSCRTCHGLDYRGPAAATVFGVNHSTWYLRRILALPNPMVARSECADRSLLFRADGFEGISLGIADER